MILLHKTKKNLAGSNCEQISYITETFAELDNMCIDDNYRKFELGTLLINKFKDI